MKKTILTFDFERYDHKNYDKYVETVQKIFKHRNIRLTEDKVDLIEEICEKLPITLIGEVRNVKIKSIIIIINQLLFLKKDEVGALNYRKKKIRTIKDGIEYHTTMYSFYFVVGDKKWGSK